MRTFVDLMTLAVPRDSFRALTTTFLDHCLDRRDFLIRWIYHLDPTEGGASKFAVIEGVREAGRLFDDLLIIMEDDNVGQPLSFRRTALATEADVILYLEDDKRFTRDFRLADLIKGMRDWRSLQGWMGKPGATCASIWSGEAMRAVARELPNDLRRNLEKTNKRIFKARGFKGGGDVDVCGDGGLAWLASKGLIRRLDDTGNPVHERAPSVTYATFVNDESVDLFLKVLETWRWRLCWDSFQRVVFRPDGSRAAELLRSVGAPTGVANDGDEAKRRAVLLDDVVFFVSPSLKAGRGAASLLDYDNLTDWRKPVPNHNELGFTMKRPLSYEGDCPLFERIKGTPISKRTQFHLLIEALGLKKSVEIGVQGGKMSEYFLKRSNVDKHFAVDSWCETSGNEPRLIANPDVIYKRAARRLNRFGDRCEMLRMTSAEASKKFQREELDFVYIDGDHTYEGCREDIALWWPKIREGGVLAGHDYHDKHGWMGVIEAVDEFMADHPKLTPRLTKERYPSWWICKH